MAKHDLKANRIQVNTLETKEQEKTLVNNVLMYNEEKVLESLDLVYRKWVEDLVNQSLPEFEYQRQKYIIEVSGEESISIDWLEPRSDLDDGSLADFYGRFPKIELWQKSGSNFFQVQGNISMSVDNDQADEITIELNNLETIILIS